MLVALLFGFALGFFGSIPVAGPVAALVVARGMIGRRRSACGVAAGGALAEGIYAALAFLGFAELLARVPILQPITRGLAAAVLTVLGVLFLRHRTRPRQPEEARAGLGGGFLLGFSITALNPTLIATWSAAAATLFSTGLVTLEGALALPFGLGVVCGIISWFCLLLVLLGRLRERFRQQTLERVIQVMGVFLLGVAAWFLVSLVRSL
jgi:threonine/homoserine/homoserine lactone efflux protein